MARTEEEVKQSMRESLARTTPTVDTEKGPVFDFLLAPVAPEISAIETKTERLAQLTSQQLGDAATTEELDALGTSFGVPRGTGKASKLDYQFFISNTRPAADITIPRGTLVGTYDQVLVYFVTEEVVLKASQADTYYNATNRTYEIAAPIEAVAIGESYDVPPYAIRRLLSTITGIDRTENRSKTSGGLSAESNVDYYKRIQKKFSEPRTVASDISAYDPENVKAVSLVYPKDRPLFKRVTARPAIDAFVIGSSLAEKVDTYVATASQVLYTPTNQPVDSIVSALVNGVEVEAVLVKDSDLTRNNSTRAQDKIQLINLTSPILLNDDVELTYNHNALISNLQNDLFSADRPFSTDVLVRESYKVDLVIELEVVVLASFDTTRTINNVQAAVLEYVTNPVFSAILDPSVMKDTIKTTVAGVSRLRVVKFTKLVGSVLDVELVELTKNEEARLTTDNLIITARK